MSRVLWAMLVFCTVNICSEEFPLSKNFSQQLFREMANLYLQNPPIHKNAANPKLRQATLDSLYLQNLIEKNYSGNSQDITLVKNIQLFLFLMMKRSGHSFESYSNYRSKSDLNALLMWSSIAHKKAFVNQVTQSFAPLFQDQSLYQKFRIKVHNTAQKTWDQIDELSFAHQGEFANGLISWAVRDAMAGPKQQIIEHFSNDSRKIIKIILTTFLLFEALDTSYHKPGLTAEWHWQFFMICYASAEVIETLL